MDARTLALAAHAEAEADLDECVTRHLDRIKRMAETGQPQDSTDALILRKLLYFTLGNWNLNHALKAGTQWTHRPLQA